MNFKEDHCVFDCLWKTDRVSFVHLSNIRAKFAIEQNGLKIEKDSTSYFWA